MIARDHAHLFARERTAERDDRNHTKHGQHAEHDKAAVVDGSDHKTSIYRFGNGRNITAGRL
jgi:hypothetical protein